MSLHRRVWPRLVAVVVVGALVVGCGSSGTKTSSATTTGGSGGSSTSGAPKGAPIKVGLMCTCSGAGGFGAYDVPGRDMYQAWVDTVNADGGIDGHPLQLIAEDDGGVPGTAVTDVQTLISDHVVAIADLSTLDQAFSSAVQQAGIPVVGVEMNNAPFGTDPDFYPEGQTNDSSIQSVLTTAKAAGATNLGNVYCAESPICAESVGAFKTLGQQAGVPVTYNAEISATAPNYTAQCVAAQQQHVSAIFIGDASAVIAHFASDCNTQGYDPIYIAEGAGFGASEETAPGLDNHLSVPFPGLPFFATSAASQQANAAIDKYFPGVRENATLWDQIDFMAWASGQILEKALTAGGLTASGTATPAMVVSGLGTIKDDTFGGLTVPLSFSTTKANPVDCWFTAQVRNGTPALTNNGQTTCASGS